jgi:DNA-binding HxlR family transcriptional regulator
MVRYNLQHYKSKVLNILLSNEGIVSGFNTFNKLLKDEKKLSPSYLKKALFELEKEGLITTRHVGKQTIEYHLVVNVGQFTSSLWNLQQIKREFVQTKTPDERILVLNNYIQFLQFWINGLLYTEASANDRKDSNRFKLMREYIESDLKEKIRELNELSKPENQPYPVLDLYYPTLISLKEYRKFKEGLTPQQHIGRNPWRLHKS